MASSVKATKSARSATTKPRILVVDDEQSLLELVDDVVGRSLPCNIIAAGSITDAREMLDHAVLVRAQSGAVIGRHHHEHLGAGFGGAACALRRDTG